MLKTYLFIMLSFFQLTEAEALKIPIPVKSQTREDKERNGRRRQRPYMKWPNYYKLKFGKELAENCAKIASAAAEIRENSEK